MSDPGNASTSGAAIGAPTPSTPEFIEFPKMARFAREIIVTEKIDGTNAQVWISDDGTDIRAGSRNRWLTYSEDNFGFAKWVMDHRDELLTLGPGRHFGEWWGSGIQRRYGLDEKRFSLFNVSRWADFTSPSPRPSCCHVVPALYRGPFDQRAIDDCLAELAREGSVAAPGFMKPEGIVIFHTAGNVGFKRTIEKDDQPKSLVAA
jgi:hypothetical protein